MNKNWILIFISAFGIACTTSPEEKKEVATTIKDTVKLDTTRALAPQNTELVSPKVSDTVQTKAAATPKPKELPIEKRGVVPKKTVEAVAAKSLLQTLNDMGLVDIQSVDPTIKVDLKYTTTDNFMHKDAYGDLNNAFLQKEVVAMLVKAQADLKKLHPNYSLIVFDGARPATVQKKMWDIVKGTDAAHYVAKPDAKGSMHNYGCAVDLSIVDGKGKQLDMGTSFDHLGREARTDIEADLLKEKAISQAQLDNRLLLRKVMEAQGFQVLKREWWHFNAFPDAVVLSKYKKIP